MKQGWEIKKLGEVCEISTGKSNTEDAVENGQYAFFDRSKVIKKSTKYLFDCDAIIVAGEGQTFLPKFYSGKFDLHQRAYAIFNFNKNVSVQYVYKYLIHFHKYFEEVAVGATAKSLRLRHFQDLPIPIPSLPEQQRIVSILDDAFSAIAKAKVNAEQNLRNAKEVFESYLQGVFEGKGEGWEEKRFEELCDLITCGVAATPKYVEESEGVPFLSAQNVRDGEVVLDRYRFISKQFHQELTKKNKPAKGDILYSRVGSKFGEAGVVEHDFEFSVYVSLTLIKPKPDKLLNYYLKYYLNSPLIKDLAKKCISSSGVPNLNVKEVREFPIKCPPIPIQKKLVDDIEMIASETKRLEAIYQQKINDLEEMKKSILEKAFNGELKTA
jgi:type I restriction enzyme S subunit